MEHYRSEPDSVVEYDSQLGDNTVLGEDDQAHIENKSGGTAPDCRLVFKTLKLTEILLDLGLHGPIPSTTYRSKSRLAASFGLDNSAALKDWMDSKAFKCYYSDLLASLQKYVSAEDMKKLRRGLRLTLVQNTLKEGEQCGHCKFSARHGIKLETFSAIDFYALLTTTL
ncbi:hypothetical protein ACLOAV_007011 [Pseudogymnoascus australis]